MGLRLTCGGVYRVKRPMLGILNNGERVPITVPAQSEITVLAVHKKAPLVDVRYGDRQFVMFAVDLSRYAELVCIGTD